MRPAYDLLRPQSDRRQQAAMWLNRSFRRLRLYRRRLNAGEPRVTASVSLLSILIATALGYALTLQPAASGGAQVNRLAEAGPARPAAVRMLDAAPRSQTCEEQTWPYIAQNCLKAGTAQPAKTAGAPATPQPETAPAKPEAPAAQAAPQAPEPANAPQQFASAQAVPLPQPRPQLEDDDDLDQMYPLDEPRRMDAPPYGYPRGGYMPPYAMQDHQLREERRFRSYQERPSRRVRANRHGIRIGDFYFRF